MEPSKLFLFGVGSFILISLWIGSQSNSTNVSTQRIDTEDTVPLRFPAALTVADTPAAAAIQAAPNLNSTNANVSHTAGTDAPTQASGAHQPVVEDDEERYETYATYEYTRPRDDGNSNTYSYRVKGRSEDGVRVTGSVNTRGQYGEGILVTEDGERLWMTTTWSDNGELIGRDEYDTEYTLNTREIR